MKFADVIQQQFFINSAIANGEKQMTEDELFLWELYKTIKPQLI